MSNVALVKAGYSDGNVHIDFLLNNYYESGLFESVLKRLGAELLESENNDFRVMRLKITSIGVHDKKTNA